MTASPVAPTSWCRRIRCTKVGRGLTSVTVRSSRWVRRLAAMTPAYPPPTTTTRWLSVIVSPLCLGVRSQDTARWAGITARERGHSYRLTLDVRQGLGRSALRRRLGVRSPPGDERRARFVLPPDFGEPGKAGGGGDATHGGDPAVGDVERHGADHL